MIATDLIHRLKLNEHPEGGYYKRTYTAENDAFSSILFLLLRNNFSAFHRIRSDEQWNFFLGDDIHIHEIDEEGNYSETILCNAKGKENLQYVVKAGHWFASECAGDNGYALCGCTVVPAFSFEGFMLAHRNELVRKFPAHEEIISRLTKQ